MTSERFIEIEKMLFAGAERPAVLKALAECMSHIVDLERAEEMRDDIVLVTPRWTELDQEIHARGDLCVIERDDAEWMLSLLINDTPYRLPVIEGEPQGQLVDVAPGVKAWDKLERYGLSKLAPGVWRLNPSLWIPGELHAFVVLRDVPDPAPFEGAILYSAGGERLVRP